MWYLIAYESNSFADLRTSQEETKFQREISDDELPEFRVSSGFKYFEIEVFEEKTEAYWLISLNELNPNGFYLLNHNTVLLRWDNTPEELIDQIKKITGSKDKFAIFPVSEMLESNFLNTDYMNPLLKVKL